MRPDIVGQLRYAYVVCPQCQQQVQILDWGSAAHQLTCAGVEIPRAQVEAAAKALGVVVGRWL